MWECVCWNRTLRCTAHHKHKCGEDGGVDYECRFVITFICFHNRHMDSLAPLKYFSNAEVTGIQLNMGGF